ncbi:MAG: hypothetical protein WAW23_03610, partial [Candidatus Methanoperedens sp.]
RALGFNVSQDEDHTSMIEQLALCKLVREQVPGEKEWPLWNLTERTIRAIAKEKGLSLTGKDFDEIARVTKKGIDAALNFVWEEAIENAIKGTVKPKKEIWQMTKKEFNSIKIDKWQGIRNDETKMITSGYLFVLLDEPKHERGRVTRSTGYMVKNVSNRTQAVTKFHREQIEKALSEGMAVPLDVLKNYPDLLEGKPLSQEEMEKRFRASLNEGKEKGFIKQEKEWIGRFNDPTRSKDITISDLEGLIKTMEKRTPL